MHGAQHMRAVGALLAARLDQATRLEAREHRIQQQMLRSACDKACAELRQHAEVEARVGQLEAKGILPINPGTHGVGCLTVAELLEELKHRDQSQPPRRESRLTPCRVELTEVLILIKSAEFVTEPGDHSAFGKSSAGHAHGLSRNLADQLRMQAHGSPP